jgi:Fe-Mn family superoxide dismutase
MSPNGGGLESYLQQLKVVLVVLMNLKLNLAKLEQLNLIRMGFLCVEKGGKLDVCGTPNQDNPLMPGMDVVELQF